MVSLEKYALAIATLSGLLLSCSDNLDDVSEDDLNPPGEIPADAENFTRSAPVVFTEVNPQNFTFQDEDGDNSDWIELFNPADTAVNLKGFSLSNSESEPRKWTFGNAIVPPQSFLIV